MADGENSTTGHASRNARLIEGVLNEEALLLSEFVDRKVGGIADLSADERRTVERGLDATLAEVEHDYPEGPIAKVSGGERIVDSPEGVWSGLRYSSPKEKELALRRMGVAGRLIEEARSEGQSREQLIELALTANLDEPVDGPPAETKALRQRRS